MHANILHIKSNLLFLPFGIFSCIWNICINLVFTWESHMLWLEVNAGLRFNSRWLPSIHALFQATWNKSNILDTPRNSRFFLYHLGNRMLFLCLCVSQVCVVCSHRVSILFLLFFPPKVTNFFFFSLHKISCCSTPCPGLFLELEEFLPFYYCEICPMCVQVVSWLISGHKRMTTSLTFTN